MSTKPATMRCHRTRSAIARIGGFTLIEVAAVMTIIGILAAIAIPSFLAYLARGHRSEARATLMATAQWMERWRTERGTYQDGGNPPALPVGLDRSPPTGTQRYNITVATPNAAAYTLTATPVGPMATDACGNLTLDSTGLRGNTGALDINTCWGR